MIRWQNSWYLALFFLLIGDGTVLQAQGYHWPIKPFNRQHLISGTFCENRSSGSILRDHFHNGIDIPLAQGGEVYSVISGTITAIDPVGNNSYVRIGRFAYVHLSPNPSLRVGDAVQAYQTIIGTTNSLNHVHFIDGYYNSEINALLPERLGPFEDPYPPRVSYIHFYANQTEKRFTQNRVTGLVDIVSRAMDVTDPGPYDGNNGIYLMGYRIYEKDGITPVADSVQHFIFISKPGNYYVKNVYFKGSDGSTYIYIPTNFITRDGYWDTRNLSPGEYVVEVFVGDTRHNFASARTPVTVMEQDVIPPLPPVIETVRMMASQKLRISWKPNREEDLAGYRLYYSYDARTWHLVRNESQLTAADSVTTVDNFSVRVPLYFVLTAVDNAPIPNESETSTLYGVGANRTAERLLLVNGYEEARHHRVLKTYIEAIISTAGYLFDSCDHHALAKEFTDLSGYDLIFYFFGADSGKFSNLEKELLRRYLQGGGHLWLSGSQLASSLHDSDRNDSSFYRTFFKEVPAGSLFSVDSIYGEKEGFWGGISFAVGRDTPLARIDVLQPVEGAAVVAETHHQPVAISYTGLFPGGSIPGSVIFLAFPLEAVQNAAMREHLMNRFLVDRLNISSVAGSNPETPESPGTFRIRCYPNPFFPGAFSLTENITVEIPDKQARSMDLSVYNVLGQWVKELYSGNSLPVGKEIRWDGKDRSGMPVPAGIYFVVLKSDKSIISQKLLVLDSGKLR